MAFENYTQLPHRLPRAVWVVARVAVLAFTLALIGWLATGAPLALTVWWSICLPVLPLLWFAAPGLWRNVCPMAFVNQLPREFGFTRALSRPTLLRTWAYPISLALLIGGIGLRLVAFNGSGQATAILLGAAMLAAFAGGVTFKGKSGWCGTFCPLAPVQKLYGQLPAVVVRNEYCSPCVGCQTHCYDFNPTAKLPSDLYDRDQWSAGHRRFFAGMYPGFVYGYFTFAHFGLAGLIGFPLLTLGLFETIHAFTGATAYMLVVVWGMSALVVYYSFAAHVLFDGLHRAFGIQVPPQIADACVWAVGLVALFAIVASLRNEAAWRRVRAEEDVVKVAGGGEALRAQIAAAGIAEATERSSGRRFLVEPNTKLLEAIESSGLHIETGCRMGMCGADPVLVVEGAQNFSPPSREERSTLERLGIAGRCRLACSANVTGPVTIDIDAKAVLAEGRSEAPPAIVAPEEPSRRVVIIGNGAAGMSAAEHLRLRDAHAHITIVSEEEHPFYNRMGIGRLIHGRSGISDLVLLEPDWYEQGRIDVWLNTRAESIDRERRVVALATGEELPYDALVLATGARARPHPCKGTDLAGSFVLRTADDAMQVRRWEQTRHARAAVVIGGGVLGIEAADALRQLGVSVTLVVRERRLMAAGMLDDQASALLVRFLERAGIAVRLAADVAEIVGDEAGRVRGLALAGGDTIPCELVVACIGIVANVELARDAGLTVGRGIVVDASMRTSDPAIFAVGDVAEIPGAVGGLWPIGKKQGEIAAAAIVGDEAAYVQAHTIMHVKLAGIDVKCFGDVTVTSDEHRHFTGTTDPDACWRRVVVHRGRIVAGVFIGESEMARDIGRAVLGEADHETVIAALHTGDWEEAGGSALRGEASTPSEARATPVLR